MMFLGLELGSTRIKSVLVDEQGKVLASGSYEWENKLVNGYWSYALDEVWKGVKASYTALNEAYKKENGEYIQTLSAIGISAMMHGYLAFDKEDNLLTPFRTWRNAMQAQASEELTEKLGFHIPQRWSVTHHYQAILNGESHCKDVAFLTTLSGYVHWKLTGEKVLGMGDASGMFPVSGRGYDERMIDIYNALIKARGIDADIKALLPKPLMVGENAGVLTKEGAKLLDESGTLAPGALCCPPEGDAGTGMVATNAVKEGTGNVSAGTSAFVMIVMKKALSKAYSQIDVVTTPSGKPVAMVHANNFTSEINAWTSLFLETLSMMGVKADAGELIKRLFEKSTESDFDCGKLFGYNFLASEPIVGVEVGRPLVYRLPDGKFSLANFMQMQIYSALGALATGMEILCKEGVEVDEICGHGGFFKTEFVGANAMSSALGAPIVTMQNAGEGGAWGMALLALYAYKATGTLEAFLEEIFSKTEKTRTQATEKEREKFKEFLKGYNAGLWIEKQFKEEIGC